jgi:hypothetical protein
MLAPPVSISLSQKKKLIADVKLTNAGPRERKDAVRKFLTANGTKGKMVVVNILKSDGAVKSTKKGESEAMAWGMEVTSNGNKKRRSSSSIDSPNKRANRASK